MNKTFPESMNRVNPDDTTRAISVMSDYINYMCERIDYTIQVIEKLVGYSSTVDVLERLSELESRVNSLSSEISTIRATANDAKSEADTAEQIAQGMDTRISTLENTTIPAIQGDISTINNTTIPAIQADVTAIDTKVGKLESSLADVESGNIATMSHAVDTYFVWKGQFVKTTSAIAIGDTISANNILATTIMSAVGEIYSATTGASLVGIDTSTNGLMSNNAQGAFDELAFRVFTLESN